MSEVPARFFSTVGEPVDDPLDPLQPSGPPDFERLQRVGRECGIEFLPPPEAYRRPAQSKFRSKADREVTE